MSEIELKLRGSPARLKAAMARLARCNKVVDSSFTHALRAVYFDTAKDDLRAKGLSFRVREEDGAFVQTLKQGSGEHAFARGEWSDTIASASPELLRTKSGRKLRQVWGDVRLLPRLQTDIARQGFLVRPRRGAVVEAVLDLGKIHVVGRDEFITIAEIELELKKGSLGALFDVALQLLETEAFHIETEAKTERGYRLLVPQHGAGVLKAEAPVLSGDESLAEVLQAAARWHFRQYLANMAGAFAQNPGCIHQMRVGMRRLRAVLYGVRKRLPRAHYEGVRLKLKHLLQSLGAARDWEVLTEQLSDIGEKEIGAAEDGIQLAVSQRRQRAVREAVGTLGSRENTVTLLEAMRWFEDLPGAKHAAKLKVPVETAAPEILTGLFNRVRRRGRHYERQSVEERHRLRIACKNLRYNLELFGSLYGKRSVDRFLKQLKPVQDDLGHLNDVSRAHELLKVMARRTPHKSAVQSAAERIARDVGESDARAARDIAALRETKPFW